MWLVYGNNLQMTEGDYGIELPVTISGATLQQGDTLRFTFKEAAGAENLLVKEYSESTENAVFLEFTAQDTALFEAGHTYVYSLDWYREGTFLCNVIPRGILKVVDKV